MKGLVLAKRHLPVNATDCRNPWLKVTEEYVVLFPQAASLIDAKMPIQGTTLYICLNNKSLPNKA